MLLLCHVMVAFGDDVKSGIAPIARISSLVTRDSGSVVPVVIVEACTSGHHEDWHRMCITLLHRVHCSQNAPGKRALVGRLLQFGTTSMTRLRLPYLAAAVLACLAAVTNANAASVTLDTLLSGGSFTSGDKMLNNFTYTHIGDMPVASQIVVTSITDANGNYGVRFNGPFVDLGGDGMASDGFLEFTVNVTDPNMEIIGVDLFGNPSVFGGDGVAQVTETFLPTITSQQLDIYDINPGGFMGADSVTFSQGYTTLTVQKDILLSAGTGAAATMSFFDQVFVQQQVPEPASAGIFAFGLLGLLAKRRRRS